MQEKAETLESDLLRALDSLRDQVEAGLLPVKLVTEAINEERYERDRISPQRVGRKLRSLQFQKGRRTAEGATIKWDDEKLARAMEAYGLRDSTHSAHSTQSTAPTPDDDQSGAECVECAELGEGTGADGAHTRRVGEELALRATESEPEPRGPCSNCSGTRFWRSVHGHVVCGSCHRPASEDLVHEWLDLDGDPGQGEGD